MTSSITEMQEKSESACNVVYYTNLTNENTRKSNQQPKISPYYDETIPETDPKFLAPVRRWEKEFGFVTSIRWLSVFPILILQFLGMGLLLHVLYKLNVMRQTTFFQIFWGHIGGIGVTGGVHRYWTHRSYKANIPMQLILLFAYSIAGQNTIYNWVRDHRVHHKMSETTADPHDANRGLFFSHMGWLMMKKHPHVLEEGKKINMNDIINDPLIQIHTKYFTTLKILLCFAIPTILPVLCWGESWRISIYASIIRYVWGLNGTWSVNSFAHLFGNKPYDKHIMPSENWGVSIAAMGEGWHNYHHTFPWDYKAAELPYSFNITTFVIDIFSKIGWVYDMKKASTSLIESVTKNRGISKPLKPCSKETNKLVKNSNKCTNNDD